MNRVVQILMSRDGISKDEAIKQVREVQNMINEVFEYNGGDYNDIEDIMYCELGLEMDYIYDIL